jgi:hypothetical protein
MEIDKFITINYINYSGILIMEITINHSTPTQLQWNFAKEELKDNLINITESNKKFGFIFDITRVGLISMNYIKEFITILEDNSNMLETKLYGTSAIAEGVIIKYIFDLINMFYKTKKPLKIVNTKENALLFIKECNKD